ncbi:MAG: hypothetical protein GY835_03340 [bacterium]|nr:hypothetical protein [bacterium]
MNSRLMNRLNANQRQTLENVRRAARRIWERPLHRHYADHAAAHSQRVIALLDDLTAGMMRTDAYLLSFEILVLLAAAYLHNIGMQDERFGGDDLETIRATHHQTTAALIYRAVKDPAQALKLGLPDDPAFVEAIMLVIEGQHGAYPGSTPDGQFAHGGETIRLQLLSALLCLGDELDIDHRRVDLELLKGLPLPPESQLHWWRCHYVSSITVVDGRIRVVYRLPWDRPDYADLVVPLVETGIRERLADLEEVFWTNRVTVALLGRSRTQLVRLVQPLPPALEALARRRADREIGGFVRPASPAPAVEPRPSVTTSYHIRIEHASGTAIGNGAQVIGAGQSHADAPAPADTLHSQLVEAESNLRLIEERESKYVMAVDVPLQLIKDKRRLLARIAELRNELGDQV